MVGCLVAFLSLAVEVGGYGQFARSIEDFGKRHLAVVPLEVNPMTGALLADACDREAHRFAVDLKAAVQRAFLPFLEVAHKTMPCTPPIGLEHQFVIHRFGRFKQEHLYQCSRLLAEVHTRLNDLGVVEHHHGTLGKMRRQVIKHVLADVSTFIDEQFGVVALCKRKLCYSLVGQRIIIVGYMYMSWIHSYIYYNVRRAEGSAICNRQW